MYRRLIGMQLVAWTKEIQYLKQNWHGKMCNALAYVCGTPCNVCWFTISKTNKISTISMAWDVLRYVGSRPCCVWAIRKARRFASLLRLFFRKSETEESITRRLTDRLCEGGGRTPKNVSICIVYMRPLIIFFDCLLHISYRLEIKLRMVPATIMNGIENRKKHEKA